MEEKLEAVTEKMEKTIEDQLETKKESARMAKQVRERRRRPGIILGRSVKT